ncbi:MAG: omptin family outer membrane protease [Treponema sp.]|nr:omptin family outer membrane protease [Treponema sp.]
MANRNISFFYYILFFSQCLFSIDIVKYEVEISTGVGVGRTNEYVYKGNKEISRLEWKENLIPILIVNNQFDIFNFIINANILSGLPLAIKNGIMEDYDYLIDNSNALSNYSEHDLYTDKHLNMTFQFGYSFGLGHFKLSPLVGFSYYTRKWSAVDGYLQYPINNNDEWTNNTPKSNVAGTGISYEQVIKSFSLGFRSDYTFGENFNISLNAFFYP